MCTNNKQYLHCVFILLRTINKSPHVGVLYTCGSRKVGALAWWAWRITTTMAKKWQGTMLIIPQRDISRLFPAGATIVGLLLVLSACELQQGTDSLPILADAVISPASLTAHSEVTLTRQQIQTYINIKREILNINQQYRSASEDFRNGRKVFKSSMYQQKILARNGMEQAEFQRVQERIIVAATRLMLSPVYDLNQSIIQKLNDLVQFKQVKITKITNFEERALLAGHIQEIEQQLAEFRQEHDARTRVSKVLRNNMLLVRARIQDLTDIKLVTGLVGRDKEVLE